MQHFGMFVSVFEDLRDSVSDDSCFLVLLHCFHHSPQFLRRPPIVAIQERNDFTLALRNAGVERRCLPTICLADQTHSRFKLQDDFRSAIGRTIIHDEDFNVRPWTYPVRGRW